VGFGGGEPTLYRRFAELCAHTFRNTGLAVTFTTHGHHLDDTLLAQLKGNVHFIRISMDGIGPTYERLGGRSYEVLARRLTAIKKTAPFGINYVVNSCTLPDIDSAAVFAEQSGASEFLLLPEQAVNGREGISDRTAQALKEWVQGYSGGMRLAVSEKGADGMPTCDPFENETGLLAYAHIDEPRRLLLKLDFEEGKRFGCPECGKLCPTHDTSVKRWRHLNFFQYECLLEARVPRSNCAEHGVMSVAVPWAREGQRFYPSF
jgi:MoaA/NifB/PqqE/SkfB family radical SAM enzyme